MHYIIPMYLLILFHNVVGDLGTDEDMDGVRILEFDLMSSESNHRVRRATQSFEGNISYVCDTNTLPQPTAEFPVVLFKDFNYNNCSAVGNFLRLRADTYEKWIENSPGPNRGRILQWRSMLMLSGANITFRACCPSGNEFVKSVSDWTNTANLHLSVYSHPDLKDNNGIWYERWLHWVMSFYLRVDSPVDASSITDCGDCYIGQCGVTKKCECASGYDGNSCEKRPSNDTYPSEKKPLVLFKEENFQGSYITVNPADFKRFAYNIRGTRGVDYKSMRILHNRTVTFARNIVYTTRYSPGSDIRNIPEFMLANPDVANGIWYNYDQSIQVDFYVRVEATPQCYNCSVTNGVCYTGNCICLNGANGANCDI